MTKLEMEILNELAIDVDEDGILFDQDFSGSPVMINKKGVMLAEAVGDGSRVFRRDLFMLFDVNNWRSMDFMLKYYMDKLGKLDELYVTVIGEIRDTSRTVKKTGEAYTGLKAMTSDGEVITDCYRNQALKYIDMILHIDNQDKPRKDLSKVDGEILKLDAYK